MARGPRKLRVIFEGESLTHYGGVYLLHRFLTRIGLKHAIARRITVRQRNNRYSVGELLLAVLYPMILGLERIETTRLLQQNGVFQYLTGLRSYPNPSTVRRFLLRLAPQALPQLRKLHDHLLAQMTARPHVPTRLLLDVDSTVLVLYGKQEQAKRGYNPLKPGRPSYHPLLCFDGQRKDCWHGELRPGNVSSATGALEFFQACFAKVPTGVRRVLVRADSGFYDGRLVRWLEQRRAGFVIVARQYAPIKRHIAALRYTRATRALDVGEFRYQPHRWPRRYRFVVIRRREPDESTEQLALFRVGKYRYQVLVTNLMLQPLNLWRFYNERAAAELIIKELKGDYALGSIPSRHFLANATYFHLLLLAYNVVNWFKRLCLPQEYQRATLHTLRQQIFVMPAQLVRTDNRPRLTLPRSGERELAWKHALRTIEHLRL
jgi:DDE family transposase